MRTQLLILSFFFILSSQAQDTVFSRPTEILRIDYGHRSYISPDCAHGHICCQAGCNCCTEMHRTQHYDTIYHPIENDVQRITVVERYLYANSHERLPVHFRFKNSAGQLSSKWFIAEIPPAFYFGQEGFRRYSKEMEQRYQKNNAILVTDENGAFHRIDLQGNELPMIFQSRKRVDQNTYLSTLIVNNQRIYGFSDSLGNLLGPLNYIRVHPFNEKGIAIVVNTQNLHGLVNCSGKVIQPPSNYHLTEIGSDRYSVAQDGKFAIMNSNGVFFGTGRYERIEPYSEGKALAQKDQRTKTDNHLTWACLDRNGNELFTLKAEWVTQFHNGMAGVFKNNKWGFIDSTGKLVIDYQFDRIHPFQNGVAPVCIKNADKQEEWFLIDRIGNAKNNKRYGELSDFKNGIARSLIRGQGYGLIDTKGREILPCMYHRFDGYDTQTDWFINEKILVVTIGKEHSYALLDRDGTLKLDLSKYKSVGYVFGPNAQQPSMYYLRAYKENSMCTLIDFQGKEILSREYKSITVLNDRLAVATIDSSNFLIDLKTDEHLLEFSANNYYSFQDDLFLIETKNYPRTYQFYDLHGKVVEVYGNAEH
jgi:hypothetical protein